MFLKIFLLFISLNSILNEKLVCDKSTLRRMDANVAKIMTIGNTGRQLPESKQQVKPFCDETYRMILEIDNYKSQCMAYLPKSVTSVIIYTIKTMINSLCKKDSKRLTKLLIAAKCGNKGSQDFHQCHMHYIDKLLGIKFADEKLRIPHVCCEYYKLFDCMTEMSDKYRECEQKEVIETISDFIRQIFQGAIDLVCGEWSEDSDKCETLPKPPQKRKNQKRMKSFMIPLIDVLESIPEN